MVHFSGLARKNEPLLLLLRERSERENQQFRFYVWFQNYFKTSIIKFTFAVNFILYPNFFY
ncbi:MAG: hypothetical protein U5L45_15165 [Saprospiraceae bacterium]|nr:hypothetical protein [Saprospiraceae bacterium]